MISFFKKKNKDFEAFSNQYLKEEKEILILTNDQSSGGSKLNNSWDVSQFFLAYYDIKSSTLIKGEGRVNWLLSDIEIKDHGTEHPYYFKHLTIYHLKVRELKDKTVPEGRLPSFYNRFMVLKVIEENTPNEQLLEIQNEYKKPIFINDPELGEFELNKFFGYFEGDIYWDNHKISVFLNVDVDNKNSWTKSLKVLKEIYNQQKEKNLAFKKFAAVELIDMANDWLEDETNEIQVEEIEKRIKLYELEVNQNNDFKAYFEDDNIFNGHSIIVHGNLKKGLQKVTVEG